MILVNGDIEKIDPKGDIAGMIQRVASAQNVHHVRQSKSRDPKS